MSEESKKTQLTPLMFKSFLKAAENAPGAGLFRSLIAKNNETGEILDILKDGEYSCAFFVSSLLALYKYFPETCATVASLENKIIKLEWDKIDAENIVPGDIIIWGEVIYKDGTSHRHVGIAISPSEAVSTNYRLKAVERHQITFGKKDGNESERKIEQIFRLPKQ